jgi:hypothetical protein
VNELTRALVRRNVAERALRAAVNDAALAGATAADIARELRITPGEAEALVDELTAERGPDGRLPESAYAVAERYAAGELPREEMLELLGGWEYEPDRLERDWDDIRLPQAGTFNSTVGRAYRDGLLTREDYREIVDRIPDE